MVLHKFKIGFTSVKLVPFSTNNVNFLWSKLYFSQSALPFDIGIVSMSYC